MFKANPEPRSRSPYQPKLIQHLIDSSDDDDNSVLSDSNEENSFDQNQSQHQEYPQTFKTKLNNLSSDDHKSNKSSHTNITQQTTKSNITKQSTSTVKIYPNDKKVIPLQMIQPTDILNLKQKKSQKPSLNQSNQDSLFSSLSQKQNLSKSPGIQIKYDTLKLSEYNTQEAKKQERLFQKNMNQFRQRFNPSKTIQAIPTIPSKIQNVYIQEGESLNATDSLEAIKNKNTAKNSVSRKQLKNQSSTPSSRIKFLQQQKQQKYLFEADNLCQQNQSQIDKLRKELKRSKDVIKTLGLKNSDLQMTLEMKNTKLQELQSQATSRLIVAAGQRQSQNIQKTIYSNINLYMKEIVKDFMEQIKNIKMNQLLQETLQNFLAEILQLNSFSVNKRLGIADIQPLSIQINQNNHQSDHQNDENILSNRLTKSIFNSRSYLNQKQNNSPIQVASNIPRNRFQTANAQSYITVAKNRQNAFMSNNLDTRAIKGVTVRIDLSSNKENATPNKRLNADQEFRLLQKSLQKLKTMQTTLQKSIKTPLPKKETIAIQNKSQMYEHQDEQKNEYSIINKSYLSGIGKDQNYGANISVNGLDRSKSRRKKIFAQPGQRD